MSSARVLVLGFAAVIAAGTLLLLLPVSARAHNSVSVLTALFTATSATCITGLTVVDTAQTWSTFGHVVILCLFQVGALGFMTVTTIFFFIINRKIDLSQRLLLVHSLNLNDRNGIVQLVRHVLFGTLIIEGTGAAVLSVRFVPEYGVLKGVGMSVFHSVSAFCNAGFGLIDGGDLAFNPLGSATGSADWLTTITTMLLVILGGLGFFVWEDIWRNRSFKKLHLHSKMVLTVSALLIVGGWVLIFVAERSNGQTIGDMPLQNALLTSLYQAVMPRSGGFSAMGQSSFTGVTKMVTLMLMFIGGSAGSAAGGVKNVTAAIVVLAAFNSIRGKKRLTVFKRNIPEA
ncbi:MAG: potassium uptake protein, TrkH family, partial [Coriobacteriia bacterium]|nr:potassium uptake protein, TrkH family [Coriobacteriia bacterium]